MRWSKVWIELHLFFPNVCLFICRKEEPVEFSGVFCAARSDGNTIYPGYEYALQCWNGLDWETIETFKGSKDIFHICSNVPENKLLILKCNTTGIENRPFLVSEDKIVWL